MDVNPYGNVTWTQYVPEDGDEFVDYLLHRVNPHTGEDERIAVIDAIDTTDYWDYHAWPGPNTWRLSVRVDRSGAIIESERVSASATLSGRGFTLAEYADPERWLHLLAQTAERDVRASQTRRLAAGRREETTFSGPLFTQDIPLVPIPEVLANPETLAALEAFLDRQYTHDRVLCLRMLARPGARWWVKVQGGSLRESLSGGLSRAQVAFTQEAHTEVV